MIFKLNNTDWTANVIAGTYQINRIDVVNEWIDGYKVKHKDKCRTRVTGSFDMFFRTQAEYTSFMSSLESAQNPSTGAYYCSFKINNVSTNNQLSSHECFLDIQSTRNLKADFTEYFEKFTVEVEER